MSSYDRYDPSRRRRIVGASSRSTLGYWIPLVLTVTVATAGLVAWVWSERQEDDGDDYNEASKPSRSQQSQAGYPGPTYTPRPPTDGSSYAPGEGYGPPPGYSGADRSREAEPVDETLVVRMSGALRRTPSPQHFIDSAGRMAAAGVAAAGAAIGLGSIREEGGVSSRTDRDNRTARREREEGFSDHERWSEEAISRRTEEQRIGTDQSRREGSKGKSRAKRTVAVVLSADQAFGSTHHDEDAMHITEHAVNASIPLATTVITSVNASQSILSHLPQYHNPETTSLFALIYAPHLTSVPTDPQQSQHEQPEREENHYFTTLQTQASTLVDAPSQILPFTTPQGYIHILRHLAPNLVYIADNDVLAGQGGKNIRDLHGWVGQVIVVAGDEETGGLVSESEFEDLGGEDKLHRGRRGGEPRGRSWWEGSEAVGLGKGVEVVDIRRVGEDWSVRVVGRE